MTAAAVSDHETRIVTMRPPVCAPTLYYAICTCGWMSPRDSGFRSDIEADVADHERAETALMSEGGS